ncbi:DUF1905 domain-containing protein [Ruicaihuangia caeni]|uniref:DUF1905 domain-containing protein n=1 Tax=Ruicaihuangia caeni TaxID=3042517 RepID=UPI00338FE97C
MRFEFDAELWRWHARRHELWTFVSVPAEASAEILEVSAGLAGGFGSLRVEAVIGGTTWRTSIFPGGDGTYALPVKKAVREAESLSLGDVVTVAIELVDI